MMAKWIKDLTKAIFRGTDDEGRSPDDIINKINSLLRRAALETDDESLQDEIWSEIKDDSV